MRIPDESLKAVGYICEVTHKDETGMYGDPHATGFFVTVPCQSPELEGEVMYYFVTAKHVATDLKDRAVYFSVNKIGGGVINDGVIPVVPAWVVHPTDPNADVAVIQVVLKVGVVDIAPVPVETFALPQRIRELNIGLGDEVHSVGLFSGVPGTESNTPVARFGNISMMSSEQIQTDLGFTEMYLVEARSIGGMSGSPVFVRPTYGQRIDRNDGSQVLVFSAGKGETLLGMAEGHWDVREEDINKPSFVHDRKKGVNYGIALVVPAYKIYDTIYRPEAVAMRQRQEREVIRLRQSTPGSDSAKEKNEKTFTQSDFDEALKKASRKLSAQK